MEGKSMKSKEIIYLSAPYTKGDVAINVYRVIKCADKLLDMGYIPFIPHLTHFWHIVSPKSWDTWLEIDKAMIPRCDAVLRLDGDSLGADVEVELAKELSIPVFYSLESLDGGRDESTM